MEFELVSVQVVDKRPEHIETSGWEDTDLMFIKGVAVREGVNANNALFEKDDLGRASHTLVGKPLKIRFVNNNPTGHGLNRQTGVFDEIVKPIGVIQWAWFEEAEDGKHQVIFEAVVWQKYYPEIANRLRQLHKEDNLKFSIEASRDQEVTPEGFRRQFNILFHGLCVVENPAEPEARSLMVAELLNEGGNKVDYEKLYNELLSKYEVLSNDLTLANKDKEVAESERDEAKAKVTEVSERLVETEGTLKEVTADRDNFKGQIEKAEKETLGAERLTKLQKYGETTDTAEELAELDKEAWLVKLEDAVANYKPDGKGQETAEDVTPVGVKHEKLDTTKKKNRKGQLLQLVEGLLK